MIQGIAKNNNKKGFSLLELVLAMFVLTMGIVGVMVLISSTMRVSMDTRNSVIASGLAQEGVELVRNIRDNNMLDQLQNISVDLDFKASLPGGTNCIVDYASTASSCSASAAAMKLYLTPAGFFTHTAAGNTSTVFKRANSVSYVPSNADPDPTGINVISRVWWGTANPVTCTLSAKCIEVRDYLAKRD